jgi:hypothetical protein
VRSLCPYGCGYWRLDRQEQLPDSGFVTSLHMNSFDGTAHRCWYFDHSLVGFQFKYRLLFRDAFPYAYQDLYDVTGLHPLA